MNNLLLQNKLLQIAKDVVRLREAHPELAHDLLNLEAHLMERPTELPAPTAVPGPYRTGGTGA